MDEAMELLKQEREKYTRLYDETKTRNADLLADAARVEREMRMAQEGIDKMNRAIEALAQAERDSQVEVVTDDRD